MKSIRLLTISLLAGFALAGCSQDDGMPEPGSGTVVQFTGSVTAVTRAAGTTWDNGDEIGVFMKKTSDDISTSTGLNAANVKHTYSASGFSATPPIYYPQSGAVDFIAYYPHGTTGTGAGQITTDYKYKVDVATQTTPADIDLLWSNNATNKSRSTAAVALEFDHKLSQLVLNIKEGAGMTAAGLAGVTMKIEGMPTTADFALADAAFTNENTVNNITPIAVSTTSGYVATYTAIVIPQGANAWSNRKMVFTVEGADYEYDIPDADDFKSGSSCTYDIAVNEKSVTVTRGDIAPWNTTSPEVVAPIELPAMVLIPKGTFLMGSPSTEPNRQTNETQHSVTLTKDFYMSKYQITNAQYAAFLNAKGVAYETSISNSWISGNGGKCSWGDNSGQIMVLSHSWGITYDGASNQWKAQNGYDNHPVIMVTWFGATEYAKWIGGSLPTEAQWEYAVRGSYANKATETATLPFGIDDGRKLVSGMANYYLQYSYDLDGTPAGEYNVGNNTGYEGKTTKVGNYPANNYGLYDMHGNVREWCNDWYGNYDINLTTNPTGSATGSFRVLRGGSWSDYAQNCRSAYRSYDDPDGADGFIGFRVVLVP